MNASIWGISVTGIVGFCQMRCSFVRNVKQLPGCFKMSRVPLFISDQMLPQSLVDFCPVQRRQHFFKMQQ